MKIATITLMRKGSRRFSNKCMADLCGKPLYMHTVQFALSLGYPYYLAHDYNNLKLSGWVNQIRRDPQYTGDVHKTNEEIKTFNIDADYFIFLQATNPVRDLKEIKFFINFVVSHKYDYAFTATKLPKGYYFKQDKFYAPEPVNFNIDDRTDNQEIRGGAIRTPMFIEDGAFYIFKKSQLVKKHFSITDNYFLIKSNMPMIDINEESDLEKARKYFENKNNP